MIFLYKSAEIVDDLPPAEAVLHLEAFRDTFEPLENLYPICFDLTFLDTLRNLAEELLANIVVVGVGRPVERTVAVLFQKGRPDKDVRHLDARSTVFSQRLAWPDGADGGSFIGFHDVGTQGTRAPFAYDVKCTSNALVLQLSQDILTFVINTSYCSELLQVFVMMRRRCRV